MKVLNETLPQIRWNPPDEGWVKVNSDVSVISDLGSASCGGLIRNSEGLWVGGFAKNIGDCDVLKAELWGIYEGLKLAWRLNCRKVMRESDSLCAINLISKNFSGCGGGVLDAIEKILQREWSVAFVHMLREGNRCADCIASWALGCNEDFVTWNDPPAFLGLSLFEDRFGAVVPRGF